MLRAGVFAFEEEVTPPFYRKIKLNGRTLKDTEPYLHQQTDSEPELGCVDGLTLQFRYQTTDVYVPIVNNDVSKDFAIEVRRNNFASVWLTEMGLAPCQRPDLPFGNCWLSGLAANVHVIDRGPDQAVNVFITDEQGIVHRFVELFKDGESVGYYPLLSCQHEQDGRAMTLLRRDDRLEFKRKYGRTLWFDLITPSREVSATTSTIKEKHVYYRMTRAQDFRGGYMLPHYESSNAGLVPDAISFVSRRMSIHKNQQGVVEKIVDFRGKEHRYEYRPPTVPGGAPLLIRRHKPAMRNEAPRTSYEYEEVGQEGERGVGEQHTALSLIEDAGHHTHHFFYQHDFVLGRRDALSMGKSQINPIRLRELHLPDKMGIATFQDYSLPLGQGNIKPFRMTFVSDATRNGRVYEFSEKETVSLTGLPWRRDGGFTEDAARAPHFTVWKRQQVSHYQGDQHHFDQNRGKFCPHFFTKLLLRERYEFDVSAGMALARAVNGEGGVFSFDYQDRMIRPHLARALPENFQDPLAQFCRDVTESKNPLGGIKRFAYHPQNRALTRKEDELGRLTLRKVDEMTGLPLTEAVYVDAKAEQTGAPFTLTEFEYGHAQFPGFVTRKTVRKTKAHAESPSWEVDLVRVYEADEHGNKFKETADPTGLNLIWIYHYNEHNSLISQLYPNGYYLQYRYDSFNQLDRVYRANGSVKKTYYDGPGNKIREIESNGEVTTSEYDALCRSVKQTVETGPPESRQKKVSVFRYNAVNSKIYDAITGLPIAHYKWDGLQRLIKYKKGKDWPKTYRFSANGCSDLFQSSQWDSSCHRAGLAVLWFCKYDGLQRLVQQSCGIFRFLAFPPFYTPRFINTYDAVGNLLKKKDGFTTTRYEYDALNRLVTTYPPGGGWTRTLRTSTGLEYGTLDSSGHRIEKRFDAAGEEIIS